MDDGGKARGMEQREKWLDKARDEMVNGWMRWASFAAVWLWCCLESKSLLVVMPLMIPGGTTIYKFYVLVGTVASLLVIVLVGTRLGSLLDSKGLHVGITVAFTTGSVLTLAAQLGGYPLGVLVGALLGGVCIGCLKISWGEMFSRMELTRGIIDISYALIVSVLLFLALTLAPVYVEAVAFVLASILCAPLLYHGGHTTKGMRGKESIEKSAGTLHFSWMFIILPFLVAFTSGFIQSSSSDVFTSPNYWIMAASGELAAGVILLTMSRWYGRRLSASQFYAVALIFVVLGFLLYAFDVGPTWLGAAIHNLGFSIFYFFMIVYWGTLAIRMNRSVVHIYAIGYFSFMLANLTGCLLAMYLPANFLAAAWVPFSVLVIFAFFVAGTLLMGDAHSPVRSWLVPETNLESNDEIPNRCAEITLRYALTPREHEVLILLARGRNASYISQSLAISHDTAKTHIKNIYLKLDIHSQQELLDMIEG